MIPVPCSLTTPPPRSREKPGVTYLIPLILLNVSYCYNTLSASPSRIHLHWLSHFLKRSKEKQLQRPVHRGEARKRLLLATTEHNQTSGSGASPGSSGLRRKSLAARSFSRSANEVELVNAGLHAARPG